MGREVVIAKDGPDTRGRLPPRGCSWQSHWRTLPQCLNPTRLVKPFSPEAWICPSRAAAVVLLVAKSIAPAMPSIPPQLIRGCRTILRSIRITTMDKKMMKTNCKRPRHPQSNAAHAATHTMVLNNSNNNDRFEQRATFTVVGARAWFGDSEATSERLGRTCYGFGWWHSSSLIASLAAVAFVRTK